MAEKILIIDDDLETLRLIGVVLQRQGYQVITASNGVDGVAMAQRENPAVIVLDIMMPDMDGYQVARLLRDNIKTSNTSILMFTAKNQVEDKVAGYEAGADEYLTKPIHPAELVARIKSMLTRQKKTGPLDAGKGGYIIGIIAPKGGVGSSTITLNLGFTLNKKGIKDPVIAELRPGHGTWAMDMDYPHPEGLNKLLNTKLSELTTSMVEGVLSPTPSGLQLLLASNRISDIGTIKAGEQMVAVVRELAKISSLVLLDIGAPIIPHWENVLSLCREIILITEPSPSTAKHARVLVDELAGKGLLFSRFLTPVINSRIRADLTLNVPQVVEILGHDIVQVISPAPELSFTSSQQSVPMVQIQPDGLTAQQYSKLADLILSHMK
jgi:CheY-like chemotaxis protein/MinD-like ATPase involved in chromosome partitioning or flagellar assembly